MSNLAYVSPSEVRPNRDRELKSDIKDTLRLWIIEFNINNSKGCAVVKSLNSNSAIKILLSGGMYNGSPKSYNITRVEEIIESPDEMLICEQIL